MNNNKLIQPKDILADGVDATIIQGKAVRKGTIAAFLANVTLYEDEDSSDEQKQAALHMLQALAADVILTGLHEHATFNNPKIEQILIDASQQASISI